MPDEAVVRELKGKQRTRYRDVKQLREAELSELEAILNTAGKLIKPGGRLAVMSYHSLEDRRALKSDEFRRVAANTSLGIEMLKRIADNMSSP